MPGFENRPASVVPLASGSAGVDQHDLALFQRLDQQPRLVTYRQPVTSRRGDAVDPDAPAGRHQIHLAAALYGIAGALPGRQRGGRQPRIGADRQGVIIARQTAGKGDEGTGTLTSTET